MLIDLKRFFHRFTNKGISGTIDPIDAVRIRTTNALLFMGLLSLPLFMIANVFLGLSMGIVVDTLVGFIFAYVYYLNTQGRSRLGIPIFMLSTIIITFLPTLFYPYFPGYSFLFIMFVGMPVLLVSQTQPFVRAISIILSFSFFVILEFFMDRETAFTAHQALIATSFTATIAFVFILLQFKFWENLTLKGREELLEKQALLVHANQLSNLGVMYAGIAHEINNPNGIILGHNQLLQKKIEQSDVNTAKMLRLLKKQERASVRIAKIVDGLKDMARDGRHDPMKVERVDAILRENLESWMAIATRKDIHFVIDHAFPGPLHIACQYVQIGQVLINLVSNAFDAVEGFDKPWVKVSLGADQDWVIVRVTDCGLGIQADIAEKMMIPFYTTKPTGRGTGLGLSVSVAIVTKHDGELFIDAKAPHTCFVLRLPRCTTWSQNAC